VELHQTKQGRPKPPLFVLVLLIGLVTVAAATAATATEVLSRGTGFVHRQGTALEIRSVELFDSFVRVFGIHDDESEASGTPVSRSLMILTDSTSPACSNKVLRSLSVV
jgi:hypothetical protein